MIMLEVFCGRCGEGLCLKSKALPFEGLCISVEPCEKCIEEAINASRENENFEVN